MEDDKTVIMPKGDLQKEFDSDRTVLSPFGLYVSLADAQGKTTKEFFFTHGFTAGRSQDNDIVIQNGEVSRRHLEVKQENGEWWIFDRNSANGIYVQDRLVEQKAKLNFPASVLLGNSGISLKIQATTECGQSAEEVYVTASPIDVPDKNTHRNLSQEAIKARLLDEGEAEDSGDYTRMVRQLIHEDRTIRGKKYNKVIRALGVLFLLSVALVTYQQLALSKARALAIDMFYDMKTLEVSLSKAELMIDESAEVLDKTLKAVVKQKLNAEQEQIKAEQDKIAAERIRVAQERQKLNSMKAKYQQYVKEATSFRIRFLSDASYEEELIIKVARELGESELELPDGFVAEVRRYIKSWQESSRMQQAMGRFEANNYAAEVISALEKEGLPLYFIYLPLQESNYDTQAIGPATPYGVAKGAWQFLASTAQQYGLSSGPLADVREYDAQDTRFDFTQATRAATKYLKYIYSTEAQASGLLVIASYNYGHNRVREMIKKMPDNPRDKNFWKFIQRYEIPKETYDYVFYIFSAAVIGEDPKHFGFKFSPPLLLLATEPT
ncbi:transglycosylase SLT domain-containing protein [Methylobacter sp.]|uniref:transglycosylase SLT domain-containing protein n=1 Tax=Methylobacter sp. TaxID=2051955 RepID=UPI002FDDBA4F